MNAKRFVSEPVILAFVALVDMASVSALVICHRDMTVRESQAAAVARPAEPVAETPDIRLHYSPDAINALLHPVAGKLKDIAHPLPATEGSAAIIAPAHR